MKKTLIKNATIINENERFIAHVLIEGERIKSIIKGELSSDFTDNIYCIDAEGKFLLPGIIDDQVHFREPGLTHKADIETESRAAIAGGITSFMEMPNCQPPTSTIERLNEKFDIASQKSLANYSFYMGATNDNIEELLKASATDVCGIKVFMGSSTGNMLVNNEGSLKNIFSNVKLPIATHCEDEDTILYNINKYKEKYGNRLPIKFHSEIRSAEACFKSSSLAVRLAKKYGTRLHLLHLSTAKEMELLGNNIPAKDKQITAEVCVHHLWFEQKDYEKYGTRIKWNPAIKSATDREALFQAVLNDKIDVIATDHAPHLLEEKQKSYFEAPSGGPLVQHSLSVMLELHQQGKISLEKIAEKMCHTPADIFQISQRGYIKEGYFADLVLVDLKNAWMVSPENILYKCKWSPFEGKIFHSKITHTFVNGNLVYENGNFNEQIKGQALKFTR